jgi:hypothetical protein
MSARVLYRALCRAAGQFPVERARGKLRKNVRDLFDSRGGEKDPVRAEQFLRHGQSALQVLQVFRFLLQMLPIAYDANA